VSQSGWKLGDGTLSRTTSSGIIEEETYEDIVPLLRIKKNEIEIGVLLSDDSDSLSERKAALGETGPERNIRIPIGEITDVREGGIELNEFITIPGFTFEIANDVYKLGFIVPTKAVLKSNTEKEWVSEVVEKIRTQSEKQVSDGDAHDDDAVEKLERLKDLHDKGALSDAEFEEKKDWLLDDI